MHVHVEGERQIVDNNIPMNPGALAAPQQEDDVAPAQDEDEEQAVIQQEVGPCASLPHFHLLALLPV